MLEKSEEQVRLEYNLVYFNEGIIRKHAANY